MSNATTSAPPLSATDPRVVRSRAAVLNAAAALLVEGGLSALTVDAVVARSGVPRTTVYRHWESRDELVVDAFRHLTPDLLVPPLDVPFEERLRSVVQQVIAAMVSPGWSEALPSLLDAARYSARIATLRRRMDENQSEVVTAVLRDGVEAGYLADDTDVEEAQLQLIGPLVMAALWRPEDVCETLGDRVVDLFLASRR